MLRAAALAGRRAHHALTSVISPPPFVADRRTRQQIERDTLRDWKRITVLTHEVGNRPMTAATLLAFLPPWFKYYVVPAPLRFVWYFVWLALQRVVHRARRAMVLQGVWRGERGRGGGGGARPSLRHRPAGHHPLSPRPGAKLDAGLARRADGTLGPAMRVVALQRLHGKVSLWANLAYRWALLRGNLSARPALHLNRAEREEAMWQAAAARLAA